MRILLMSDSHGVDTLFPEALERADHPDLVLHAGDLEGSEQIYEELCGVPFYCVRGNNDFLTDAPSERVLELEGHRLLLTHGHLQEIDLGYERLRRRAAELGCDVLAAGHTHRPLVRTFHFPRLLAVNPGSLSQPRQESMVPTCAVLTLERGRRPRAEILTLQKSS